MEVFVPCNGVLEARFRRRDRPQWVSVRFVAHQRGSGATNALHRCAVSTTDHAIGVGTTAVESHV